MRTRAASGALRGGLIALVLALAGCASLPTEYREPPPLRSVERQALNERVFDRVWSLVQERYFDVTFHGVDWQAARERYRPAALRAADSRELYEVLGRLCGELRDSHLIAMDPRRAHEFTTERRAAAGFRFQLIDGQRVVTDVVPGSPAARAGIRPGWILLTRNGAPIRDGERFIGQLGQPIRLELRDEQDALRSLTVSPELVDFARHEAQLLPDNLLYLRFDRFDWTEAAWLNRQLREHRRSEGLVLDLRQNGGGRMFALNMIAADFFRRRVSQGTVIGRDRSVKETRSFGWRAAKYPGRVVVLVGPNTASAAEILSHVLQHYGRATVLGRTTAGAVVQAVFHDLPDGGQLELPISDYVGLDGQRLEGRGVAPNRTLPAPTFADLRAARDAELTAAIAAVREAPRARDAKR